MIINKAYKFRIYPNKAQKISNRKDCGVSLIN
ncbi:helix-turn-helix domain-containing protein [Bacillus paramobilis]